jgi:hypothetical protein
MEIIAGWPCYPIEISKDGTIPNEEQKTSLLEAGHDEGAGQITDMFVISHGWNNDMEEARALYEELFGNMERLLVGERKKAGATRNFAIVGVFWPSKKFAEEDLIPAVGPFDRRSSSIGGNELPEGAVKEKLANVWYALDWPVGPLLDRAQTLVDQLERDPAAQQEFVKLIRTMLAQPTDTTEDASDLFFTRPGDQLLHDLRAPIRERPVVDPDGGGAVWLGPIGPAVTAGVRDAYTDIKAGAWRLLNYATYYTMKERTGVVGGALNALLAELRAARTDLRLHLIGHSFGARVVAAAADGRNVIKPSSLTLLQGAFSHNGFSGKFDGHNDGFFRKVVAEHKVSGPIVITHTYRDYAVGRLYPLASRISRDNRSALGDANDRYGGLGRNGAVRMKEDEFVNGRLVADTGIYAFTAGKVHNLLADDYISDHGDVRNGPVANAVLAAAGL